MIIDRKGKLFGKVSIVDILIIVIILASIGGAYYKYTKSGTIKVPEKLDEYVIQFYTDESPNFAVNSISKGQISKEFPDKVVLGKVTDIKTDKSVSWGQNDKGEFVQSTRNGYSSLLLTIEGKGKFGNSGLTVGKSLFLIGKTVNIQAGDAVFSGKIYSIKKK